jgi:uncharacterized protein DUF1707
MASDPRIRASDADRDRVAEALREHHAAGRLTMEEFQERLDRAYAARTLGELDALTADLPAIDLYQLPIPAERHAQHFPPAQGPQLHGRLAPVWLAAWGSWVSLSLILLVVWLLTGAGYPWFLWPVGILGASLAGRWLTGVGPRDHPGRSQLGPSGPGSRRDIRAQRQADRRDRRSARLGLPADEEDTDSDHTGPS